MKLDPFPSIYLVDFLQYSSSEHGKRRPPILKNKHSAHKGHGLTIHECPANPVLGPAKTQYDLCQRRIKESPVVTEHPDNPKILVDTGDPGLPFRKFVFRARSQMMYKVPKEGVSFFQKEGDSVSCLAEKIPAPMRDGRLALKFSGFVGHRIASRHFDQRSRGVIRSRISHESQHQGVGQRACSPYRIQIWLELALLVKTYQGLARHILLLLIQFQTIKAVDNPPQQGLTTRPEAEGIPPLKHLEETPDPRSHQSFAGDVFTSLALKLDNISLEDFSKIGQDPQTSPAIHPQGSGKNLQETRQSRLQITHHPVLLPRSLLLPIHILPSVKPDPPPG